MASPLSSFISSSSLEAALIKSSSESMPVVSGVGGAVTWAAAETKAFLPARPSSPAVEVMVASAAFLFLGEEEMMG